MPYIRKSARSWAGIALIAVLSACTPAANTPSTTSEVPSAAPPHSQASDKPAAPPAPAEKPVQQEQADVVLVGSELEGLYLARAAADEGLSVKIIDPRPAFGGQVLQGEMLFLDAVSDGHGKSLHQGRVKELFDGFKNGKIRKLAEFEQYFAKLSQGIPVEQGVSLEQVGAVQGPDGREHVKAVTYTAKDGTRRQLTAQTWVENTDSAELASKLKVKRLPGLEAFYGQERIEYMSAGYMMKFKNVDWKAWMTAFNAMSDAERRKKFGTAYLSESYALVFDGVTKAYKASDDRLFLRGLNAVYQRDGEVLINALLVYDINPADPASVQYALDLGKKEMPLILEHFRKSLPGWEKAELNGFPAHPYIREYNHYETEYTLQVSDMLSGRMFPDNVSIAGYPLDLQGITSNKWGIEMGRPDKYGMPLRSFLLKGYDNIVMAGKNVGSTAIAYGSARIQPNTSLAAESIGVLLAQLHASGKPLTSVTGDDLAKLHQTLASKHGIKLTGVVGDNKLAGWTKEELRKLDSGEINYPSYKRK
ncbi:FAD-dependent oxidoreductase [Paenibacillus chartarius]|uniref:FAD-dependent oxidoreductase n=1 Tax=Paenibacillus chartarius TaxID=747481 RepID=A0ABV6DJB0_9BACL